MAKANFLFKKYFFARAKRATAGGLALARPPAFLGFFNENCDFAAVCSKADMAQGDERRPIDFPA